MLTPEELKEIDHEISKYDYRQAASLEALAIVQHHRGWVSDESLLDIASYLEMSPAELDSISTFYNLIFRKQVGKYVIRLCDSVSCWICGFEEIRSQIKGQLGIDFGQTTDDKKFTLVPNQCLGTCDHAPAMLINDELYRDLTVQSVSDLLRDYQCKQ